MFRRFANLFRGFFGLFVSGLERRNPEALLEVEKEHLREQIAKYNEGLASHAGLCERLMTQIKQQTTEEHELRAKTTAHLKAGNRAVAGQYAVQLQSVQRNLEENQAQLQQAEQTYENLLKARDSAVATAKAKLEELRRDIDDMKVKKATAELSEMTAGMVGTIGGAGDTLDRLHTMVQEEREKAAGRARVARDSMEMHDVELKESEQEALADEALAEFAAKEGLALPSEMGTPPSKSTSAGDSPAKSMGPLPEES